MARGTPLKSLVQYAVFAVIVILAYRMYVGNEPAKTEADPFRQAQGSDHHPKNVHAFDGGDTFEEMDRKWAGVRDEEKERVEKKKRESIDEGVAQLKDGIRQSVDEMKDEADQKRDPGINVGDMPKELEPDGNEDLMDKKRQKALVQEMKKQNAVKGYRTDKDRDLFLADGIDWALEEEMKKRRRMFYERVEDKSEEVGETDFKDMHEVDENLAFVTAGSHTTYPATLEFIYSIQYFYPHSAIAIYDIGLTSDERDFIRSLCNTEVETLWMKLWPDNMYKMRHRVWRPTVLQFALAKFVHFVYVEPGRFIYKQRIRDYIKHSQVHGVTVAGRQYKHSSFSVTNPHMYTFLAIDERKLQKVPHFDFSIIILHNTSRVRHYFMRFLLSCIMEEYCISPPGSKPTCDPTLEHSRKYANCHRYDESAINIILNKWHNYKTDEFLMQDVITKHFDGKDVTKKLRVCNAVREEV